MVASAIATFASPSPFSVLNLEQMSDRSHLVYFKMLCLHIHVYICIYIWSKLIQIIPPYLQTLILFLLTRKPVETFKSPPPLLTCILLAPAIATSSAPPGGAMSLARSSPLRMGGTTFGRALLYRLVPRAIG